MQCYDCAAEQQISPAVAVCSTCGAGLCTTHAVPGHAEERLTATLGNPTTRRLPGRRLYCHTCAADGMIDAAIIPGRVAASVG